MGNKYHTICCGVKGILFDFEMVEGGDHPSELPHADFSKEGKTAGLLLLTKTIHHIARYVVVYYGFCVLLALLAYSSKGNTIGLVGHWGCN